MVPRQFSEEDVRPALQTAQSLAQRARQGEDFAELAKSYSEGPGAAQGGVIDRVLQIEELGPELGPKVAALQPGQVTDPVQSGGRFIIMKLLERVAQPGQPEPGVRLAQIVVRVVQTSDAQRLRGPEAAGAREGAEEPGQGGDREGHGDDPHRLLRPRQPPAGAGRDARGGGLGARRASRRR